MMNLLVDAPPVPDAPEPLDSPWQMSLLDLTAHDLRYTARLMNRDDLSREERQHWGECVENIERHHEARRWMYQRPIRDVTCWHCGQPFETRDPAQGLCPPCERLADEDRRVTRF